MTPDSFGNLLTQGLKSIAALEKTDLTELQHELGKEIGVSVWTIYKWRKGASIPHDERTIRILARACVERGRMDRTWLHNFLWRTTYENRDILLTDLYPPSDTPPTVRHNLPRRQHKVLVGRDQELTDLRSFLSPRHRVGVVCISGGGGVGKTALALEIAHYCYEHYQNLLPEERFEAIIWVTAKNLELLSAGPAERQPTFTDLDGVYRAIAELMEIPAIFRSASQAEQNIIIMRFLAEHRVLLMLDNLEDVDDPELMVFLRDLPAPSKAIVTTRHRIDVAVPIHLRTLDETTALELITLECERRNLTMTEEQGRQLLRRTGGLPLAIIRTIARMAWRGSSIETEISQLNDPQNEIYHFCFGKTVDLIKSSDAYNMFMALSLFTLGTSREALGFVAGYSDDILRRDEALSDLEVLSLCSKDKDRFSLEPLTRTQASAELRANPDFEQEARARWIDWFLDFSEKYGGKDWQEWHLRYDHLENEWENILDVFQWCFEQGYYEKVRQMWLNLREFTHIYGYWHDRLNLLDWIIVQVENHTDWKTAVMVLGDKAFTLSLIGSPDHLKEAARLLKRAWSLHDYAEPTAQARICTLTASVCIRQKRHGEAHNWLDRADQILVAAEIDDRERARDHSAGLFDRGENWLMMGDHARAKAVFQEMLDQTQRCGWQRGLIYAQNWLAYLAILEGDLSQAEKFLQMGWAVALRTKEKRIGAFYRRSFAYYFQALGNRPKSLEWAKDALSNFERLGMQPEIREMQELIGELAIHH